VSVTVRMAVYRHLKHRPSTYSGHLYLWASNSHQGCAQLELCPQAGGKTSVIMLFWIRATLDFDN
jgi:hypothetical protein